MRSLKLFVAAIGLLGSAAAVAGGYCLVVPGMPNNCRFIDEQSCATAAAMQRGGCIANNLGQLANATTIAPPNAKYCLVSGGDSKCFYFDAPSCAKAASELGGTCLTKP